VFWNGEEANLLAVKGQRHRGVIWSAIGQKLIPALQGSELEKRINAAGEGGWGTWAMRIRNDHA